MPLSTYKTPQPTPIYSFAALKTKQREIKDRALQEVVHITENGNAAYIFCSEEVLAQEKARAVEEALYEQRLIEVLEQSEIDHKAGRIFDGIEAAKNELNERLTHGSN
jgi:hypothetical protein